MGRRSIAKDEGLVIVEPIAGIVNTSIHMMFVYTPLAVFWLDKDFKVVDKVIARPWASYYGSKRPAMYVLELNENHFQLWDIEDTIHFHETT